MKKVDESDLEAKNKHEDDPMEKNVEVVTGEMEEQQEKKNRYKKKSQISL